MNRLFRYALIVFGECILIAIMLLLFSKEERDLMILDTVVLSIAYLLNVFGYPTLIKQDGENETAGYGLAWTGTGLYSIAVLLTVVLCYWIGLSLAWQVVIHCALLFLFLSIFYFAGVAAKHAGSLEGKYKMNAQSVELLKAKARMLQAVIYDDMDDVARQEVIGVVERTGYLIPNRSPLALTLEKQIENLLDSLSDAVTSRQPDAKISSLTEQCKIVLKQRMALPN